MDPRPAPPPRWTLALALALVTGCAAAPYVQGGGARDEPPYTLIDARGGTVVVEGPGLCSAACALVVVDGFNNGVPEARRNFEGVARAYAEAGGVCAVFGFTWPGDAGLTRFARAEEEAGRESARALAGVLAAARASCPSHPLHLAGHSLAARVILAALAQAPVRVDSVALAAPAVADDALLPDGEFGRAVRRVGRLAVYYNSQDYVALGLFYPLASRRKTRPLGLFGSRDAQRLPENVREYDKADLWGPRHAALRSFDRAFWEEHQRTVAPPPAWATRGGRGARAVR